jgi:hypothetical protein
LQDGVLLAEQQHVAHQNKIPREVRIKFDGDVKNLRKIFFHSSVMCV